MAKCCMGGCTEKPIGGFVELIDAGTFDNPNDTLEGMRTGWCKAHESMLRPTVAGSRGRWLTKRELAQ